MMRKISLQPIEERITQIPYTSTSSLARSFSMISPELVYYVINNCVTYGAAILIHRDKLTNILADSDSIYMAALIRAVAIILATVPLLYSFKKEYVKILPCKNHKKVFTAIITCILGIALAAFFNKVLAKMGTMGTTEGYAAIAEERFKLPIWAGVLLYGVITPVTEEIVHRGLIYNRVRRYFNLPIALVVGPLIFGVAHGNLPQVIYAFILGIAICVVYEKTGAFIYPVLFHASANSFIYVAMKINPIRQWISTWTGCTVMGIISAVALWLILSMKPEDSIDKE